MAAELSLKEKLKIIKLLPRYNGETPLRQYMETFNVRMEALGLSQEQALDLLKSCLDGKAAEKFKLIKSEENRTWDQWIDLFAQQLATPYLNEISRDLLNARRKKVSEDLETYMKDIKMLVARAYNAADKYTDEQINYFIRGLPRNLKKPLKRHAKFTEPDEALAEALKEEQLQQQLKRESMTETAINLTQVVTDKDTDDEDEDDMPVNYTETQQKQNQQQQPNPTNNQQQMQQRFNPQQPFNQMNRQQNQQRQQFHSAPFHQFNGYQRNQQYQRQSDWRPNVNANNYSTPFHQVNNYRRNQQYHRQSDWQPNVNANSFNQQSYRGRGNFRFNGRQNGNGNNVNQQSNRGNVRPQFNRGRGRQNPSSYRINMIQPTTNDTTSTTTGSRSISPAYYLTMMAIFCLFHTVTSTGPTNQLQICYNNAPSTLIEYPKTINCNVPKSSEIQHVNVELFVKRRTPTTAEATKCTATITTTCVSTVAYIQSGPPRTFEKHLEISTKKCKALINANLKNNATEFKTENIPVLQRQIFGESCGSATNYEIKKGKIATTSSGGMISDLSLLHGCDPKKDSCEMEDGTVIWKMFNASQICPYVSVGNFSGLLAWPEDDNPELTYLMFKNVFQKTVSK
uniref:Retrotransposon gag domain-containing protein n=1 Tax=Panagrolaimus davidi TaxID=227884 RepID=A0A914PB88_9BILA